MTTRRSLVSALLALPAVLMAKFKPILLLSLIAAPMQAGGWATLHKIAHWTLYSSCAVSVSDGITTDIVVRPGSSYHETNPWNETNGRLSNAKLWGNKAAFCGGPLIADWMLDRHYQKVNGVFAPKWPDTAATAIGLGGTAILGVVEFKNLRLLTK